MLKSRQECSPTSCHLELLAVRPTLGQSVHLELQLTDDQSGAPPAEVEMCAGGTALEVPCKPVHHVRQERASTIPLTNPSRATSTNTTSATQYLLEVELSQRRICVDVVADVQNGVALDIQGL